MKNYGDVKTMVDNMIYSPYFPIACKMLWRNKVDDPNEADIFEAMHEIAKIDNKVNQGK